jgi:hypothetical protein
VLLWMLGKSVKGIISLTTDVFVQSKHCCCRCSVLSSIIYIVDKQFFQCISCSTLLVLCVKITADEQLSYYIGLSLNRGTEALPTIVFCT